MWKRLISGQKPWIIPFEKSRCFALFKTFLIYPKDQKMIFTNLLYPKKINVKKFDIWTKTMVIPFEKSRCFALFKTLFFLLSKSFFFIQNIKKQSFLNWFLQKRQLERKGNELNEKKFDFWIKTMDYLL